MTNAYEGTCYRCGKPVPPKTGVFEKTGRMQARKWPGHNLPKWLVQHHDCAVLYKGTAVHYVFHPIPVAGET